MWFLRRTRKAKVLEFSGGDRTSSIGQSGDAPVANTADQLISDGNKAEDAGDLREACRLYREAVRVAPRYARTHLNLGIGLEAAGDADGAIGSYEAALEVDAGNAYAAYNLGKLFCARGRLREAEKLLTTALDSKPDFPEAMVVLSEVHDLQGELPKAATMLQAVLQRRPDYVGALYNYGIVLRKLGKSTEAEAALERHSALVEVIESFRRSLAAASNDAVGYFNLGNSLVEQGRFNEAKVAYQGAIDRNPDFVEAHTNLGNVYRDLGDTSVAIGFYRGALELNPGFSEAHFNLGNALRDNGQLDDAITCYRTALAIKPGFTEALYSLGHALLAQGHRSEAVACYERVLELDPDNANAHSGMGDAFNDEGRADEAIAAYRRALAINPRFPEAHFNLGNVLGGQGERIEALACYQQAITVDPGYVEARWSFAMTQLTPVYDSVDESKRCRAGFAAELKKLEDWFQGDRVSRGFKAVGVQTPFFLAYQEKNNRELLRQYGELCARLMGKWLGEQQIPLLRVRRSESLIHVGIVSRYFQNHSVWQAIVKGWFQQLDRTRFALHAFCIGNEEDEATSVAEFGATRFVRGKLGLRQWVQAITAEQLDVLIYPEIGMDTMTVKLASMRLAPVQVATWGHPETTGLPTMDYYLSAENMEPDNAQENYTEQLVKLPGLGCCFEFPRVLRVRPDLEGLGIESGVPLLLCPGVPFKYAPQQDWVWPEIARQLGRCRFIFFTHKSGALSMKLRDRLIPAFRRAGLSADEFVTFIPWQSWSGFYALLERANVFLDTIGFSGFNTAMQAVDCGTPIATREGRFLRGRLASGILKRIGLQELVATSDEDYVALVVRLVQDQAYRARVRERMVAGRELIVRDSTSVRALEDFLLRVIRT
jgi:protein O-GlcNAc transferase